jgi:hypothetical protein
MADASNNLHTAASETRADRRRTYVMAGGVITHSPLRPHGADPAVNSAPQIEIIYKKMNQIKAARFTA